MNTPYRVTLDVDSSGWSVTVHGLGGEVVYDQTMLREPGSRGCFTSTQTFNDAASKLPQHPRLAEAVDALCGMDVCQALMRVSEGDDEREE